MALRHQQHQQQAQRMVRRGLRLSLSSPQPPPSNSSPATVTAAAAPSDSVLTRINRACSRSSSARGGGGGRGGLSTGGGSSSSSSSSSITSRQRRAGSSFVEGASLQPQQLPAVPAVCNRGAPASGRGFTDVSGSMAAGVDASSAWAAAAALAGSVSRPCAPSPHPSTKHKHHLFLSPSALSQTNGRRAAAPSQVLFHTPSFAVRGFAHLVRETGDGRILQSRIHLTRPPSHSIRLLLLPPTNALLSLSSFFPLSSSSSSSSPFSLHHHSSLSMVTSHPATPTRHRRTASTSSRGPSSESPGGTPPQSPPLLPGLVPHASVTALNFEDVFEHSLREAVSRADFIAVDLEMTGVESAAWRRHMELETLQTRYLNARHSASNFGMVQLGVCAFEWKEDGQYYAVYPYNFQVFPRQQVIPGVRDLPARNVLCQLASLEFLGTHGFDFNAWVRDGIPYLSEAQEDQARAQLGLPYRPQPPRRVRGGGRRAATSNPTVDADVNGGGGGGHGDNPTAAQQVPLVSDSAAAALAAEPPVVTSSPLQQQQQQQQQQRFGGDSSRHGRALWGRQHRGMPEHSGNRQHREKFKRKVMAWADWVASWHCADSGSEISRSSRSSGTGSSTGSTGGCSGDAGPMSATGRAAAGTAEAPSQEADVLEAEAAVAEGEGLAAAEAAAGPVGAVQAERPQLYNVADVEFGYPFLRLRRQNELQLLISKQVLAEHFPHFFLRVDEEGGDYRAAKLYYCRNQAENVILQGRFSDSQRRTAEALLQQAVGLRRVLDAVVDSGKPIVGHNCLLDMAHIMQHFYGPLPGDVHNFASHLSRRFPVVFDTKYMVRASPSLRAKLAPDRTSLAYLYDRAMRLSSRNPPPHPPHPHPLSTSSSEEGSLAEEGSGGPRDAQRGGRGRFQIAEGVSRYSTGSKYQHEAGYDAFMTGVVFAEACRLLGVRPSSLPTVAEHVPSFHDMQQQAMRHSRQQQKKRQQRQQQKQQQLREEEKGGGPRSMAFEASDRIGGEEEEDGGKEGMLQMATEEKGSELHGPSAVAPTFSEEDVGDEVGGGDSEVSEMSTLFVAQNVSRDNEEELRRLEDTELSSHGDQPAVGVHETRPTDPTLDKAIRDLSLLANALSMGRRGAKELALDLSLGSEPVDQARQLPSPKPPPYRQNDRRNVAFVWGLPKSMTSEGVRRLVVKGAFGYPVAVNVEFVDEGSVFIEFQGRKRLDEFLARMNDKTSSVESPLSSSLSSSHSTSLHYPSSSSSSSLSSFHSSAGIRAVRFSAFSQLCASLTPFISATEAANHLRLHDLAFPPTAAAAASAAMAGRQAASSDKQQALPHNRHGSSRDGSRAGPAHERSNVQHWESRGVSAGGLSEPESAAAAAAAAASATSAAATAAAAAASLRSALAVDSPPSEWQARWLRSTTTSSAHASSDTSSSSPPSPLPSLPSPSSSSHSSPSSQAVSSRVERASVGMGRAPGRLAEEVIRDAEEGDSLSVPSSGFSTWFKSSVTQKTAEP